MLNFETVALTRIYSKSLRNGAYALKPTQNPSNLLIKKKKQKLHKTSRSQKAALCLLEATEKKN